MDFFSHTERMNCVRCPFCKILLAVEVPCKLMEVVQVNCGHCNNISYYSPIAPMFQSLLPSDYQMSSQGPFFTDYRRNQTLLPPVSSPSYEPTSPKTPYVVKPPEKKSRLPSAYNKFMRDEIQRIKADNPDIPHREAFSMAAKNWAHCAPRGSSPTVSSSSDITTVSPRSLSLPIERGNMPKIESFDVFKQFDRKN